MKIIAVFLTLIIFGQSVLAQSGNNFSFDKAQIIVPNGNSSKRVDAVVIFSDTEIQIKLKKGGTTLKTFKYTDIKAAEYSYTEQRMWKEGIGLGAASVLFPPAMLVALPLGFAKNKHHYFTFRSEDDFAVLKISKSIRKLLIPTFETKTGIKVEGKGADK